MVCREPKPDPVVHMLGRGYLDFVLDAVQPDGRCHNRMGVDGNWSDEPGLGDWWGRALWGLGVAAATAPTPAMQARALLGFRVAARARSPHMHAMAFAALGAGELLLTRPDEMAARVLLQDAATAIGLVGTDSRWPWPEPRMRYANGAIVEALLLAGTALPSRPARAAGLRLLTFLIRTETRDGHVSVTPVTGRGPGETGPGYDQQPIEVAALADACARAYALTRDAQWHAGVSSAWEWFLGNNDSRTPMFDPDTGAGFDGLERDGRNGNQGAESTLAFLSTAQHAQRLTM